MALSPLLHLPTSVQLVLHQQLSAESLVITLSSCLQELRARWQGDMAFSDNQQLRQYVLQTFKQK